MSYRNSQANLLSLYKTMSYIFIYAKAIHLFPIVLEVTLIISVFDHVHYSAEY